MTNPRFSRRAALGAALAGLLLPRDRSTVAQEASAAWSYPMRLPGRAPGDGFFVRIAYACENAAFYPGWWHTGENWHLLDGDTGGSPVLAAAAGDVVFAGYDYPGPVVILRHGPELFSMYGHLDYALDVAAGDRVDAGQRLGTVLSRTDGNPSHLHFEIRTFLTRPEVNGDAPRYGVHCGFECPPGPGYWPIGAPEHPSDLGWRNPTHAIAHRAFPNGTAPDGAEAIVAAGAPESAELWTAPPDRAGAQLVSSASLRPGDRLPLIAVAAGDDASTGTGAEATRLWYRVVAPDGRDGWIRAAIPASDAVGADGRPSAVRFVLLASAGGDGR